MKKNIKDDFPLEQFSFYRQFRNSSVDSFYRHLKNALRLSSEGLFAFAHSNIPEKFFHYLSTDDVKQEENLSETIIQTLKSLDHDTPAMLDFYFKDLSLAFSHNLRIVNIIKNLNYEKKGVKFFPNLNKKLVIYSAKNKKLAYSHFCLECIEDEAFLSPMGILYLTLKSKLNGNQKAKTDIW